MGSFLPIMNIIAGPLCVTDKMTEVWISKAYTGHAKHAKLGGSGGMPPPPKENFENLPQSE